MSTCDRLKTLGSQPIMPKNLPGHWATLASGDIYLIPSTFTSTSKKLRIMQVHGKNFEHDRSKSYCF